MDDFLTHRNLVHAPEFPPGDWLNTPRPLSVQALRGRVFLVDIWDYTCVYWLRTLPYIREWYARYAPYGLEVIGVHTPAFAFGRERRQVELATQEFGVRYPVFLDNEFRVWNAYNNRFWPARYLIDRHGLIRYSDFGEGGYAEFERVIQALLREVDSSIDLPPIMQPLRDEDRPEVKRKRPTSELRGGLEGGALGNPEGYAGHIPVLYRLPRQRTSGAFYVAGAWQAGRDYLAYQGSGEGIIQLPYDAVEVNAVLSPHSDAVERLLHPDAVSVEIWQDERPIDDERRGADLTADGRVIINRPRIYNLVRNPAHESHELTIRVQARGVAVYAFSFVGGAG